jgi:hypothetical protein
VLVAYDGGEELMDQAPEKEVPRIEDPMYVGIEQFEAGMAAIADLLAVEALRLLVGSSLRPSPIQFELRREDDSRQEILSRHGISYEELLGVFEDLDDCLNALLSGSSIERFSEVRSDPNRWEDGEHESRDIAERKMRLVMETFDAQVLRQRLWIKQTAKTAIPGRLDWEVLAKKADAASRLPGGASIVFANLRLATEPSSTRPIALTDQLRQINITVDAEDVGYMIDSLTRLRRALLNAEAENGHE